MAKKQTRRSISVSRATYERLKAFCETNNISMSQLVETRVNDFLGGDAPAPSASLAPPISHHVHQGFSSMPAPSPFRPVPAMAPRPVAPPVRPIERPMTVASAPAVIAAAPVVQPSIAPVASVLTSAGPVAAAPVVQPSIAPVAPTSIAAQPVAVAPVAQQVPMTSAAARFAVEPPPPIIKPRPQPDAVVPKPTEKRADQIFTF